MLSFPNIDHVAFSLGPLEVRWYGLAYVAGILIANIYTSIVAARYKLPITKQQIDDYTNWAIISIIIGGRLGHVIFYDLDRYLQNPVDILKIYEGGMSFHGALLAGILSAYLFARKNKIDYRLLFDLISLTAPIGVMFGRIANFINAELYGRITDVPWAMIFPGSDGMPRHPTQLYEAATEGLLIAIILGYLNYRFSIIRKRLLLSGLAPMLYSIFRMIIENYKEPEGIDSLIMGYFTVGHVLTIPMFILGIIFIYKALGNNANRF